MLRFLSVGRAKVCWDWRIVCWLGHLVLIFASHLRVTYVVLCTNAVTGYVVGRSWFGWVDSDVDKRVSFLLSSETCRSTDFVNNARQHYSVYHLVRYRRFVRNALNTHTVSATILPAYQTTLCYYLWMHFLASVDREWLWTSQTDTESRLRLRSASTTELIISHESVFDDSWFVMKN